MYIIFSSLDPHGKEEQRAERRAEGGAAPIRGNGPAPPPRQPCSSKTVRRFQPWRRGAGRKRHDIRKKSQPTSPPPTWEDDPQASEGVMWGWRASPQQLLGRRCQGGQINGRFNVSHGDSPREKKKLLWLHTYTLTNPVLALVHEYLIAYTHTYSGIYIYIYIFAAICVDPHTWNYVYM